MIRGIHYICCANSQPTNVIYSITDASLAISHRIVTACCDFVDQTHPSYTTEKADKDGARDLKELHCTEHWHGYSHTRCKCNGFHLLYYFATRVSIADALVQCRIKAVAEERRHASVLFLVWSSMLQARIARNGLSGFGRA